MDSPDVIWCNNSYIPDTEEYMEALGSFGSAILIIGGLVTLSLFMLCIEQIVYTNQTAHSTCKRHIYWIVSVFPVMTLMSLLALLIPRSHNVCLSVKMVYLSIGLSHFTDLTIVMFGGEERMLEVGREDTFNLRQTPVCCCCKCLPFPPVTKYSLRLVVLLTDQLPFIQAIYYVVVMILLSADNITMGDVNPASAFLWLNIVQFSSVLFGVYGFMILSRFSRRYLHGFQYRKKALPINLLLILNNLRILLFSILGNYNAFPCIPPYVSSTVYKQTLDNSLSFLEMMILAPFTFWQYHDPKFGSPITHRPIPDSRSSSVTHTSIMSGSSNEGSEHTTTTTATSSGDSRRTNSTNDSTHSRGGSRSTTNSMNETENGAVNDCEKGDYVITTQVSSIMGTAPAGNKRKNESRSKSRSRDGSCSRVSSRGKKGSESANKKPKSAKTQSKPKRKKTTTFYDLNETSESTNTYDKTTKSNPDNSDNSTFSNTTSKTFTNVSLCPGVLNRAMSLSQPNMKARSEYERLY